MDPARLRVRGASLSGGLPRQGEQKAAACTRSLSGPVRAGASKNQGAFRLKLRLTPPLSLMLVRRGQDPQRSAFLRCQGERSEVVLTGPTACQCVSLTFHRRNSHQLPAFCAPSEQKSVATVTDHRDHDQGRFAGLFVLRRTGMRARRKCQVAGSKALAAGQIRSYFSRATTNSGAHCRARLISQSGKWPIAFWADSA